MLKKLWTYFFPPAFLKEAKQHRDLLRKIFFYRRNQLDKDQKRELSALAMDYREAYTAADRAAFAKLEPRFDKLLKKLGGHYYRHYHWYENTETLVVAAILAIGIRSYFLQPFKIPTNSMWPTYHGMTYQLSPDNSKAPSALDSAFRWSILGYTYHRALAQSTGEILIPVFSELERAQYQSIFRYRVVSKPFLGVIPMRMRAYDFYVNGTISTLTVPYEFSMDKLLLDKFFPQSEDSAKGEGTPLKISLDNYAATGVFVQKGAPILDFELESGDMLFVDRLSYYFHGPRVGDPIVFRTRDIAGLAKFNGGLPEDKYYIKRLAGYNGSKISIQNHALFIDGKSAADLLGPKSVFAKNAQQIAPYKGYGNVGYLCEGETFEVPADFCFALGDNSNESLDSRYWGAFPQKELIGKAIFIYYPFTARWGISH